MTQQPNYSADIDRIYSLILKTSETHGTFSEYILEDLILKNLQNFQ